MRFWALTRAASYLRFSQCRFLTTLFPLNISYATKYDFINLFKSFICKLINMFFLSALPEQETRCRDSKNRASAVVRAEPDFKCLSALD